MEERCLGGTLTGEPWEESAATVKGVPGKWEALAATFGTGLWYSVVSRGAGILSGSGFILGTDT